MAPSFLASRGSAVALTAFFIAAAVDAADWYADIHGGSRTCKEVSTATPGPAIFASNPGWYEPTLALCCARFYNQDSAHLTTCNTGGGPALNGTDKFYVDWTGGHCARDCAPGEGPDCGGVLPANYDQTKLTDTVSACCTANFPSKVLDLCVAESNHVPYIGSGNFYADTSGNLCLKDCNDAVAPCGGVNIDKSKTMFATLATCCTTTFGATATWCETASDPNVTGTDLWFVEGNYCKKDCSGKDPIICDRANAFDPLFADAAKCCAGEGGTKGSIGLQWQDLNYCKTRSDPGKHGLNGKKFSGKWFPKSSPENRCVKDCDTADPACDSTLDTKSNAASIKLYDDAASCCANGGLAWLGDSCKTSSISGVSAADLPLTGNGNWYGSYSQSVMRCVTNCKATAGTACGGIVRTGPGTGNTDYTTVKECCSSKFNWYNQDLCEVISTGAGVGSTSLYYVKNYEDKACVQDCPDGLGVTCGGNPKNKGEKMFKTPEACCADKLDWIDADACKSKTTNGINSVPVGSSKWYKVDGNGNTKCSKDCDPKAGDPLCGGIKNNIPMYSSHTECCTTFGWVAKELCEAYSLGKEYTETMWWPDQSKGICYKDCKKGTDPTCGGAPKDKSVALYDTSKACCGTMTWKKTSICEQTPDAALGDDQYYVDHVKNRCVKNCPESQGKPCGGMAETYNPLFGGASECCGSPQFQWMDEDRKQKECYYK